MREVDREEKYNDKEWGDLLSRLEKVDGNLSNSIGKKLCNDDVFHRSTCSGSYGSTDQNIGYRCWYCGSELSYKVIDILEVRNES